jgi:hypothetical protein
MVVLHNACASVGCAILEPPANHIDLPTLANCGFASVGCAADKPTRHRVLAAKARVLGMGGGEQEQGKQKWAHKESLAGGCTGFDARVIHPMKDADTLLDKVLT